MKKELRLTIVLLTILSTLSTNLLAQYEGAGLYRCMNSKCIYAEPKSYSECIGDFYKGKEIELTNSVHYERKGTLNEVVWHRLPHGRWIQEGDLLLVRRIEVPLKPLIDCSQPPPILDPIRQSIKFTDSNGNGMVDAEEECLLAFEVANTGPGPSQKPVLSATGSNRTSDGVWVENVDSPSKIEENEIGTFSVFLKSDDQTKDGNLTLEMSVTDGCGFGIYPFEISLKTRAFQEPQIMVVDDNASLEIWKRGQPIQYTILVQNTGDGVAEDVLIKLNLPEGVICYSDNGITEISELLSGEAAEIVFDLLIPKSFTPTVVETVVTISEKRGLYGSSWTRSESIGELPKKQTISVGASASETTQNARPQQAGMKLTRGYVEFNANPKDVIVERVAVVAAQGMDCGGVLRPGQDLASYVEGSLLGYYEVVERRNLERVLDEQKLALSGIMFEKSTVEAGCNIGAQGIIFTEFGCIGGEETIQVKLVDCQTSELYWSATGHGSSILDVVKEIEANLDE